METLRSESPLRVLRSSINKNVLVKVKEGSSYTGQLIFADNTMNLVMINAEEVSDEDLKPVAKYGTILIRGSQILYVVIDYRK
ncbi:MAG: ribonucleoprotein [Desulfurococcaceae archaeon]|jgi:small nuclear ribonucleoprotein|nr:ribonucleoprotein [Desulfurococcaceae archaeon]